MAAEAVIFPNQPLFMVDRGWQRHTKKAGKKSPQGSRGGELETHLSRVPEVSITVPKRDEDVDFMSRPETKMKTIRRGDKSRQFASTQFLNYEPVKSKRKQHDSEKQLPERATPKGHIIKTEGTHQDSSLLKQSLPGTATALYSYIDPEVSSFQKFVSYYPTRMATSMYPISKAVPLTYNPIKKIWFPAVVEDEALLHTIIFSCAMHYFLSSGQLTFRDSDLLMKVILNRLNGRLQNGKYSDLTIGAVSCLALCENHLGNHKKWKLHAAGMSEMVRARGGFANVRDEFHMKIHRADTIGAVDTLSHPNFPRPIRATKSLFSTMALEPPSPPIKDLLMDLGLTQTVLQTLVEMSFLCHALNQAAEKQTSVDPLAFDEDVICIQHDLLGSLSPRQESVERLCIISALISIQMLTREVPFTRWCSWHISKELKEAFPALDAAKAPARLIYWMLFMGGLVSVSTKERLWFRRRLKDLQRLRSDLTTWDKVEAQLQQVFWVKSVQTTFGLDLWKEVNSLDH